MPDSPTELLEYVEFPRVERVGAVGAKREDTACLTVIGDRDCRYRANVPGIPVDCPVRATRTVGFPVVGRPAGRSRRWHRRYQRFGVELRLSAGCTRAEFPAVCPEQQRTAVLLRVHELLADRLFDLVAGGRTDQRRVHLADCLVDAVQLDPVGHILQRGDHPVEFAVLVEKRHHVGHDVSTLAIGRLDDEFLVVDRFTRLSDPLDHPVVLRAGRTRGRQYLQLLRGRLLALQCSRFDT